MTDFSKLFAAPAAPVRDAVSTTLYWGTVTSASPVRVHLDGESAPLDLTLPNGAGELVAGDRVRLMSTGTQLEIVYRLGGPRGTGGGTGGGETFLPLIVKTAPASFDPEHSLYVGTAPAGTSLDTVDWKIALVTLDPITNTCTRTAGLGSWTAHEAAVLTPDYQSGRTSAVVGVREIQREEALSLAGGMWVGTAPLGTLSSSPGWKIRLLDQYGVAVGLPTYGIWDERE